MKRVCLYVAIGLSIGLCAAACGDDGEGGPDAAPLDPDPTPNPEPTPDPEPQPDPIPADGCDPLQPSHCALPWPSSRFLEDDPGRATGYALTFGAATLPKNSSGVPIDPEAYRQMDGFAIGTPIVVYFPGLDVSNLTGEADIVSSLDPAAPIVLLEVGESVRRVAYWAEIDLQEDEPEKRGLIVRPAEILKEGTRYVVGMRDLRTRDGEPIEPSPAFALLRGGQGESSEALAPRAARFEEVSEILEAQGVARGGLVLAWDFVTASCDAVHGPVLAMREQGRAALEAEGHRITITDFRERTVEEDARIAIDIEGTFKVPHFLRPVPLADNTAWRLNLNDSGQIEQDGFREARVWIRIPRVALEGEPMGLANYGHGLNGSGSQVNGGFNSAVANEHGYIFFATDMWGMSGADGDVGNILQAITDMSHFPFMADRLIQGIFNYVALTWTMQAALAELPELRERGIVVDPTRTVYSGISQGGIYGASVVAVSQEMTRGHLGVPGQNYSILLHRSKDFIPFLLPLEVFYTDSVDRLIALGAAQVLWDRSDPGTYYRHLSESPFVGNAPSSVLLASATGDYQVPLLANEITARSGLGVALMPGYGKAVPGVEPTAYPHVGSGLVNYSFGNPWPPVGNLPPMDEIGDPHGRPRGLAHHQLQMVHFWRTGEIIDVCGGDGCTPE